MKNIKIFGLIAFFCTIVVVNISLSRNNNNKLSGINLDRVVSISKANTESGGGRQVNCYSSASFSLFHQFYDCGDCCSFLGKPKGTTLKCKHNESDC